MPIKMKAGHEASPENQSKRILYDIVYVPPPRSSYVAASRDVLEGPHMAGASTPPHPGSRRGIFRGAVSGWKLTEGWRLTAAGAIASVVITLICLVAGVSGALSIAVGVAIVAVSLLLEGLAKNYEIQQLIREKSAATAARLERLETRTDRTANALEGYHDLSETGQFRPELTELLATASVAAKLSSNLIRRTARELLHETAQQLAPLKEGRLQLDASYSSRLLDAMKIARNEVQGTSPINIDDEWWTLELYKIYLEEQKKLILAHKVQITRIFIAESHESVHEFMAREAGIGIHVRFVSSRILVPRGNLAQAYVIFDRTLLHRTIKAPDGSDVNLFSENEGDLIDFRRRFQDLYNLSQAFSDLDHP